jgi:hypothetical protein
MKREELKKILDEEWVPPYEYSLFGENDTGLIMEMLRDGTWLVYTRDRGQRFSERFFKTEDEACKYIYEKLTTFYRSLSEEKMKEVIEHIKKHYR